MRSGGSNGTQAASVFSSPDPHPEFHLRGGRIAHSTEAPLSRQIRQLEEELGTSLVNRQPRQLTWTAAGELVRQHAPEILARVD